jgi:hypothetical protein
MNLARRNNKQHQNQVMKKKLTIIVSSLAVVGALSCAIPAVLAQQTNAPATGARRGAERHPAIRRAIVALEEAKVDMKNAAHDFGGHRVAALEECDKAIEQLKEALKYDKQ